MLVAGENIYKESSRCHFGPLWLTLSTAERRGTPVLLSALVADNSGNSPQMAEPRRSCEIGQSMQRLHVGCDNRCLLVMNMADYMDVNF